MDPSASFAFSCLMCNKERFSYIGTEWMTICFCCFIGIEVEPFLHDESQILPYVSVQIGKVSFREKCVPF